MLQYNSKTLYVVHYRYYYLWNNHSICWNIEQFYRNNGQKHTEQKNRIISTFISIIGSSLASTDPMDHEINGKQRAQEHNASHPSGVQPNTGGYELTRCLAYDAVARK